MKRFSQSYHASGSMIKSWWPLFTSHRHCWPCERAGMCGLYASERMWLSLLSVLRSHVISSSWCALSSSPTYMVTDPSCFLIKRLCVGPCVGSWDLGRRKKLPCESRFHLGHFLWSSSSVWGVLQGVASVHRWVVSVLSQRPSCDLWGTCQAKKNKTKQDKNNSPGLDLNIWVFEAISQLLLLSQGSCDSNSRLLVFWIFQFVTEYTTCLLLGLVLWVSLRKVPGNNIDRKYL